MDNQIRLVGVLHLVWGALGLAGIIVTALIIGLGAFAISVDSGQGIPGWLTGGFILIFLVLVAVAALPSLLAGYGLLTQREWGRTVAIVVSAIHLAAFPLGTALGVYSLIVLLRGDSAGAFASAQDPYPNRA